VKITQVLEPAWTTDWIGPEAREKLRQYGIAPPMGNAGQQQWLEDLQPPCPRCGSGHTQLLNRFGSTACKALYQCADCLEPFDYFKCH
jgi:ring-1,2-phenylacetyl-CoA epoxidase subunit PaaD